VKRFVSRSIGALLALCVLLGCGTDASAAAGPEIDAVISETAACLCETAAKPQVGSVGGEWAVLGLARSGCPVPEGYFERYYTQAEAYVTACGGVLHTRKYTEYSRVILALTAIGKDPADVAGYNLLTALGDYEKTVWQGLNGPVWALVALDCGCYAMPQNPGAKTQATREMYVEHILSAQLPDGGFSLSGAGGADPGMTAMALQALSNYTGRSDAAQAVLRALACLSAMQGPDGGFSGGGTGDSESCAQVIMALHKLGISPDDDRFVKNGSTLLDNLLSFRAGGGGFAHTAGGGCDQMATEQALLALAALRRAAMGRSGLLEIIQVTEQSGDIWGRGSPVRSLASYYHKAVQAGGGVR